MIRRLLLTNLVRFDKVAVFYSESDFMSNATKTIINRQWHIIELLVKTNRYLSTEDIRQYLQSKGVAAELRTIQRDLNDLKQIFPLECRTDDKPYGWRWARVQYGKKQELTLIQALAFRLIETQLQEHLPSELMDNLQPLFIKARFMLMDPGFRSQSNEMLLRELMDNLPKAKSDKFHQRHEWQGWHSTGHPKPTSNKKSVFAALMNKIECHQECKHEAKLIKQLKGELEKLGLVELVKAVER